MKKMKSEDRAQMKIVEFCWRYRTGVLEMKNFR